jgi:siphovirus family protein
MGFSLYEINAQIEQAWSAAVDPETGEIISEEAAQAVEQLTMAREDKIENLALYYKNLTAEAKALKNEKLALEARQSAAEKKAESIKKYLASSMNGEKYKSEKVAISWRKSESVSVDENAFLPDDYMTFKEPVPNLTAIKKALKAGEKIDGATLTSSNNIQIK